MTSVALLVAPCITTKSVMLVVAPLTHICRAVRPLISSLTRLNAILILAFIGWPLRLRFFTDTLLFVIEPFPYVNWAIWFSVRPCTMLFVLPKLTFIYLTCRVAHLALAFSVAHYPLSIVCSTVWPRYLSFAMTKPTLPLAFINCPGWVCVLPLLRLRLRVEHSPR